MVTWMIIRFRGGKLDDDRVVWRAVLLQEKNGTSSQC